MLNGCRTICRLINETYTNQGREDYHKNYKKYTKQNQGEGWFTNEAKNKIKARDQAYKLHKQNPDKENMFLHFSKLRNEVKLLITKNKNFIKIYMKYI